MDMEEKKLTADATEQALPVQELPADIPAEVRQKLAEDLNEEATEDLRQDMREAEKAVRRRVWRTTHLFHRRSSDLGEKLRHRRDRTFNQRKNAHCRSKLRQ